MIRTESVKYQNNTFNEYEVEHGELFPDAIIDAVKMLYGQRKDLITPEINTHTPIPIEDAKAMIIESLTKFDSGLGQRAEKILNNPNRMNLNEEGAMHCIQAGVTKHHLQQKGMWDMDDKSSPDIINDKPYATIHLDYDGTINSVIYLAHELGHAIADDIQVERGNNFLDNPAHMEEVQAYFIQHIVRMDLEKNENPEIAQAAKAQYAQEFNQYKSYYETATGDNDTVLHGRPPAFTIASAIAERLTNAPNLREYGSQVLLGAYGPADISKTLAVSGIERLENVQEALNTTIPTTTSGGDYKNTYETSLPSIH